MITAIVLGVITGLLHIQACISDELDSRFEVDFSVTRISVERVIIDTFVFQHGPGTFPLLFGYDAILHCDHADGKRTESETIYEDVYGQRTSPMQLGNTIPDMWVGRSVILHIAENEQESRDCKVGLIIGVADQHETLTITLPKPSAPGTWEYLDVTAGLESIYLEIDESVNFEQVVLNFVIRHSGTGVAYIAPIAKRIWCPNEVVNEYEDISLLWSPRAKSKRKFGDGNFVKANGLGLFSDLLVLGANNGWKACTIYYSFGDGKGTSADFSFELRSIPIVTRNQGMHAYLEQFRPYQ